MTQSDIRLEKLKIKNSSILKNKNAKIDLLKSQQHTLKKYNNKLSSTLLKQEEEFELTKRENIILAEENLKLKNGFKKISARLDNAEKKLGK